MNSEWMRRLALTAGIAISTLAANNVKAQAVPAGPLLPTPAAATQPGASVADGVLSKAYKPETIAAIKTLGGDEAIEAVKKITIMRGLEQAEIELAATPSSKAAAEKARAGLQVSMAGLTVDLDAMLLTGAEKGLARPEVLAALETIGGGDAVDAAKTDTLARKSPSMKSLQREVEGRFDKDMSALFSSKMLPPAELKDVVQDSGIALAKKVIGEAGYLQLGRISPKAQRTFTKFLLTKAVGAPGIARDYLSEISNVSAESLVVRASEPETAASAQATIGVNGANKLDEARLASQLVDASASHPKELELAKAGLASIKDDLSTIISSTLEESSKDIGVLAGVTKPLASPIKSSGRSR